MDALPASVVWAHVLPHTGASMTTSSLATTCRSLWAARPSAADVLRAEVAALERDAPWLCARLGGADALSRLGTACGVKLAKVLHAARAAAGAARAPPGGAPYKSAMRPLLDGSLVRPPSGSSSADATFDFLVLVATGMEAEGARRAAVWFAVLLVDFVRSRLPWLGPAAATAWMNAALCCAVPLLCLEDVDVGGSKSRVAVRRLQASVHRTLRAALLLRG